MAEARMKRWNLASEKVMNRVPRVFKASGPVVDPARTQAALNAHHGMWEEPLCVPDLLSQNWKCRDEGHQESESRDGVPSGSEW